MLTDKILVTISASADGAIRELQGLESSAGKADAATLDLGKSLKTGLVAGAAALAGTGLVSFLSSSADKFVEAQTAAAQFARATNATVEEAGKFTTVARQLGLDMNDLIEINAEFSKKIEEQPGLLSDLNVEIAKNADGSTNMTKTLVSTIDALGGMEDGLKAAQIAAELFGEEGSKQLAGFYLQGIEVADLMDRINFIDRSDDAKRFAASSLEMNLAMEQLQITIGAKLVPVMTELIDSGLAVFGFLSELPEEVYLMVGAAAAWYAIQKVLNAELVVTTGLRLFEWGTNAADAFLTASGAANKAKVAIGGLAGVARNAAPFLALAAAIALVNSSIKEGERVSAYATNIDNLNLSLEDQAKALEATEGWWNRFVGTTQTKMQQITLETRKAAEASLANSDATESERAAAQALLDVLGDGTSAQQTSNLATEEGQQAARDYAEALGGAAGAMADASAKQRDLADLISEGVTSGKEFSAALADAGEAAGETARDQEILNGVLAAYNALTYGAIEATEDFYAAFYAAEEAINKAKAAIAAYNDEPTPENETEVFEATRRAADAAATQWQAAQARLGNYVTESEIAAQRLATIEILLNTPGFPPGAAAKLKLEAASITAAAVREADFKIPVGFSEEDINTSLAIIKGLLADPSIDPELKAQLELDQTSLETAKGNIETLGVDAATEVKVEADTTAAEDSLDGVTGDQTANVTVDIVNNKGAASVLDAVANPSDDGRTARMKIDITNNLGAGSVLDNVANPGGSARVPRMTIDITNNLGAASVLNNVANPNGQARIAYIDIVTRGSANIPTGGDGPDQDSVRQLPPVVNNRISVDLDGFQLRSTIREEVRFARAGIGGLA